MISVQSSGSFSNVEAFIARVRRRDMYRRLSHYGALGVEALRAATPKHTGETAQSWEFRIVQERGGATIEWFNTNVESGVVVAILIQYGHGTNGGGYVDGIDYVN